MLRTTVGRLLLSEAMPPDVYDPAKPLDAKAVSDIMSGIIARHPEQYGDISKRMTDLGREAAFRFGGFTFSPEDLTTPPALAAKREELRTRVRAAITDKTVKPEERTRKVVDLLMASQKPLTDLTFEHGKSTGNPLAMQALSGSRGKPSDLKSLMLGDLVYSDNKDRQIPYPVLSSYSEGLRPAEWFAAAFGSRKGAVDTKMSVADVGYLAKQIQRADHRLLITDVDSPHEEDQFRGLPVETNDPSNQGALLAFPVGRYPRNTLLTPRVLRDIQSRGVHKIVVRSAITSHPGGGGVYARDVGVRERGGLPARGDFVGFGASQAIGEATQQAGLNSKHTAGVAGTGQALSGFKLINQLVQAPAGSPYWAAHSSRDGSVDSITDAPGGGKFIHIDGHDHYVPSGQNVTVKDGDKVEAGDQLSNGVPNPVMLVNHKGLGEGRRQYVKAMGDAMRSSGLSADRRNLELLSRGMLNYMKFTQPHGGYFPDDVVTYDALENGWEPRERSVSMPVHNAIDMYLEAPVLHHTIGTRVTKRLADEMHGFGIKKVIAHPDPPPFEPQFVRGQDNLRYDPDWLARMYGSYQNRSFRDAVYTNAESNEAGTSFVPSAARSVSLNRTSGPVKSYSPAEIIKPKGEGVL